MFNLDTLLVFYWLNDQDTNTPEDNPEIVDCNRLSEIALALNELIRRLVPSSRNISLSYFV